MRISAPDETLPCPVFDDEPTERFAVQRCNACGRQTAVPLFLATTQCENCLQVLEVAPLLG